MNKPVSLMRPLAKAVAGVALLATLSGCVGLVAGGAVMTAVSANDRRTLGAQTEDKAIAVKGEASTRSLVGSQGHVNVTSFNRKVLLTGEVRDEAMKAAVEREVRSISGITSLINELEIAPPSSYTTRSNDTLITTRIKASLVNMQTISANSFKVVTERGNVYLMGMVTPREAQIGTDVARGVPGVQKVVKVFEYINDVDLRALPPVTTGAGAWVPAMGTSARPWVKPAVIGAVVLALAGAGIATFTSSTPAPEVTFIDLKGEKISTKALRGKVVMVNFWATSCVTCVKEMPQLVDTYNKYKDQGLEFIAVAMQYDPPNYVINFTETRKLPFTVALDSGGDIARSFGDVTLTPTTFVIDKEGQIIKRYVGEPPFADLHVLLEKELAG